MGRGGAVNVATQCACCKEPIEGREYKDASCDGAVCEDCAFNLDLAMLNLNKHGMRHLYTGPCPDNGPEGLKKS